MFWVAVVLAGLLQVTVLVGLNLLAFLTVVAGLRRGPVPGLLIGMAIGIFTAVLSASSFELVLVSYSLIGLISGMTRTLIFYSK